MKAINNYLLLPAFAVVFLFSQCKKQTESPQLDSIVPSKGLTGDPVVLNGAHLANAQKVTFNNTASLILNNSASELSTVVPSGISAGLINVTVHTNGGISNQLQFELVEEPEITDPFPPQLEMTVPENNYIQYPVLIYGDFLSGVISLTFNDVEAEIFTNNQRVITTTVPAGVPTGQVKIKVRTVKGTSTIDFTVLGPPPGGNIPLNFSIVNIPPPGYVPLISNDWTCGLFSEISDSTFVDFDTFSHSSESFTITGKYEFDFNQGNDYNYLNFIQITNSETGEILAGLFSSESEKPCIFKMILISSETGEITECTVDVEGILEGCAGE
jgi:hypothetical protein